MAIIFSDDFNRANSTNLGSTWNEFSATPAGGWQILSNQLRGPSSFGSNPNIAETTATAHAAKADMLVTMTRVTGANWDGGPGARKQSGADTLYYLDVVAGASSHSVYRRVASTDTLVGTASFTSAAADVLGLQAQGSTLKIFKGGVQQGTNLTDTNITAAGFAAVVFWPASMDTDDFSVDDLTVAASQVPYDLAHTPQHQALMAM